MSEARSTLSEWQMLRRFWQWMRPHKRAVLASLVLVPIVAACSVAQPRILGLAIDEYMLKADLPGLTYAALAFFGVIVLEYISGALQGYLLISAGTRATGALRRDVYRHVMGQGQWFFDRRPTGSLLSRTTTDVEALGESFLTGVVGIVSDVAKLVGIVGYMLSLNWQLTLAAFSVLPLIVLIVNVFRKSLRDLSVTIRVLAARLNGFMAEHVAGVEVVQLMDREERTATEFAAINRDALKTYHRSNLYDAGLYAVMDGLSSICIGAVVWFGSGQVAAGLTAGLLVSFVEYVQRALVPIKEFSAKYATMQRSFAALERIYGLLDTDEAVGSGGKVLEEPRGAIRFRDVRFTYPGTESVVLDGVSFDVRPGQVVAVVGSTGAGKSTVCRLLTRAYDGYEGSLTIDGVEVRELEAASLRDQIAVVHQDVFLFRGSVEFNLGMGDPRVTRERMEAGAALVRADRFIEELPDGYAHDVGERGGRLSAGQAQLVSFARAMVRDPAVVVLDEATASVDPGNEAQIQAAIETILELKTVVVVAHRLSTIRAADLILVMERGKIVERGTHDQLLTMGGRYAELHAHALTAR